MNKPQHIGIIMDGNGRWAKQFGLPRTAGHKKGAETLKKVLTHARKTGIKIVTLYAFSSENWLRPKEEVQTLMGLFKDYLKNDVQKLLEEKVRISFIGDRTRFELEIQNRMNEIEQVSKDMKDFHVVLALSYGARDDIVFAVKKIAQETLAGNLSIDSIDSSVIKQNLSTQNIPDPDFIIRTSGEERISNFLLWEIAYSEFYFTPVLWPDFNETEFDKAIQAFQNRKRRFGKI